MIIAQAKLSDHMAAEITGVDLSKPVSTAERDALLQSLHDNLVICIRGQDMGATAFRDAMAMFGTPVQREQISRHPECADVNIISSEDRDVLGDGKRLVNGANWHTDDSFMREPCSLTMLHGVVVPPAGGDTQFTNMYAAYEGLSEVLRQRIAPLKVVHKWHSSRKGARAGTLTAEQMAKMPDATHPIVRTHPETGRKALYLNPNRMDGIAGLSGAESDALIDELVQHATQPKYQYRHKWQRGDIVIWDNRCTMHKANGDYPDGEMRRMYRVVVAGTVPM